MAGVVSIKACRDTLRRSCVFAFIEICGSRSSFQRIRSAKHRHTIFHTRVGPVRFHKKHVGTRYVEPIFLHRWDLRVMRCIPVHPGRETSMHYFSCSGGPSAVSGKSTLGHVTSNLCFSSGGIYGSCSAFRCICGAKRQYTIFHAQMNLVRFP
jgi:hypothetical protein